MRIRAQLLMLIAAPLAGLLGIGLYSASVAQNALLEHETQAAESMSSMLAIEVERALQTPIQTWRVFTSGLRVQGELTNANNEMDVPEREAIMAQRDQTWTSEHAKETLLVSSILDSALSMELAARIRADVTESGIPRYGEVFITDRYGANVAQSGMTSDYVQSDEQWWQEAMSRGLFVGDLSWDQSAGVHSVDIGLRIENLRGEPIGVIKVLVSIDSIIDLVNERAKAFESDSVKDIVLLTQDGRLIHSIASPQLELSSTEFATWIPSGDRAGPERHDGSALTTRHDGRSLVLGVVTNAADNAAMPWRVLVLWDASAKLAQASTLRMQILVIAGAIAASAGLIALLLAQRMTRRVTSLASHAHAVGEGDRAVCLLDNGADELGELSRVLNKMTQSIDASERRIREERTLLEAVLSAIPFHVYWRDDALNFTGCNTAFAMWLGRERPDELIGRSEDEIEGITRAAHALFNDDEQVLTSGQEIVDDEREIPRPDGAVSTVHVSKIPLYYPDGSVYGMLGGFTDVTERKQLETQLLQSQKLESIGQLAAGIAHEINTPAQFVGDNTRFLHAEFANLMRIIEGYARELDENAPPSEWAERTARIRELLEAIDFEFLREEIPQALTQSLDGIDRIKEIVVAMKEFSHPGSKTKEFADINKAINSTATVCSNRWKYVADIEMDLDESLPSIPCLVGEFNQVVLNIIVNAADAIEERFKDQGKQGLIKIVTRAHDGEMVEITITDNGGGIPEHIKQRVFDPFFTTKGVGKGTGQGLAISRDVIVQKHGGTIDIETDPGRGTTFIIRLPLNDDQARQEDQDQSGPESQAQAA